MNRRMWGIVARRLCLALTLAVMLLHVAAAPAEETPERLFKARGTSARVVTVCGRQLVLFAQNAPEWAELRYAGGENPKRFGACGCVVTALANATANAVSWRKLSRIGALLRHPIYLSEDYLNRAEPKGCFAVTSEEDVLRFWPLVLANLASGNNCFGGRNPQNVVFYRPVLEQLGLRFSTTKDIAESLRALANGALVITCSSGRLSPFARGGHFFIMAAKDEEAVWILDSYFRDDFPLDRAHRLTIVAPGLVRVSLEALAEIQIETQFIIWPDEDAGLSPAEFAEIIARSDAGAGIDREE